MNKQDIVQNVETGKYYDKSTGQEINGAAVDMLSRPFYERAAVGAGRVVDNALTNVGINERDPFADQAYDDLKRVAPWSTGAGEVGMSAIPAGRGIATATAIGGALGGVTGDPRQSMTERVLWGAGGELGGQMAGRVIGRLATRQPVNARTPEGRTLERTTGERLTPYQATGDPNLEILEGKLEANIGSSGMMREQRDRQMAGANKKVMEAIGVEPGGRTKLTQDVLTEAEDNAEIVFREVGEQMPDATPLSQDLSDQLRDVAGSNRQAQRVWMRETGTDISGDGQIVVTGPGLMRLRSQASKQTKSSNANKADDARNLIDQIDDIVMDRSGPEAAELYQTARDNWRMLKAVDRKGTIDKSQDISFNSLTGRLWKWRNATGAQQDVKEMAQAGLSLGKHFGRPGTAEAQGRIYKAPLNWLGGKAYLNAPGTVSELFGMGQASNMGKFGGAAGRGLLQNENPADQFSLPQAQ